MLEAARRLRFTERLIDRYGHKSDQLVMGNGSFRLGKLEEEFERKFNSLPQYSPMTFDKKGASVTKKKSESPTAQEELFKGKKGTNGSISTAIAASSDLRRSSHPRVTLHPLYLLNPRARRLHNTAFPCSLFLCVLWYIRVISI